MLRRFAVVLVVGLLAGAAHPTMQQAGPPSTQPPLTFRVEANFVEVDAFVTDAGGREVTDLSASDFEVLEDGKPQTISAFAHVNIPVTRAERPLLATSPIDPDVQTNLGMDGRIYLFVLDDLHVDFTRASRVRDSLSRFFERDFGANDLAAVVFTGGRTADSQDFTNNVRLLVASVNRFTGSKLRSPTLERLDEYSRLQTGGIRREGDPIRDPMAIERGARARNAMTSLRKLADFMVGVHGRRKAMVLVSEGIDYDVYNLFENSAMGSDVLDATRDAIAAATRANVSIYPIDPRGLAAPGADLITAPGVAVDDPSLGLGIGSSLDELRLSQSSLRTLAEETGGFAVVNQNDFASAFDRLVRDNSSYYVLGYYAANDRRDGRFRKIDVRLTRPGLTVRARKGYVAPRGRATPTPPASSNPRENALRVAVESPLAMSGIPMRLFAAPYKGSAPNATVALSLEIDINGFTFTQQNGTSNDTLELAVRVLDNGGKVRVNDTANVDLALMPETLARARARGFRLTSAVTLPPGRYQLRVSTAENGGDSGTVVSDLEVPDFYKAPLVMSGVTMTSAGAAQTPTARIKDDPVGLLLMRAPATLREFERGDQLLVFAEVYDNRRAQTPYAMTLSTEVRAEGGTVVFGSREERSSTELQGGRGGYGYTVQVPLRDLAPGLYVLRVAGRTSQNPDEGVSRDIQFRVR